MVLNGFGLQEFDNLGTHGAIGVLAEGFMTKGLMKEGVAVGVGSLFLKEKGAFEELIGDERYWNNDLRAEWPVGTFRTSRAEVIYA